MTLAEHAKITDALIEQVDGPADNAPRRRKNRWNTEVTPDGIAHFAWGVGDDNPLWLDLEYGAGTKYGSIVAPPTWLYSAATGPLGPGSGPSRGTGMPGLHALHAGDSWQFYEKVKPGDVITIEHERGPTERAVSKYSGEVVKEFRIAHYLRQDGKEVARCQSESRRHERGTPKKYGKYDGIEPWVYSESELEAIAKQYESERPRGKDSIDWSEIVVGGEIPVRQKGPLTVTSLITYLMGWGSPFTMTDRIAHEYLRLHPGANVPDARTNVPDFPERAHWDESFWKEIGFPLGYDIGTQRISWFGHLLTDWVGDDGTVEELSVQVREPNWLYDLTWLHGKIIERTVVDGKAKVRLELWAESQRGRTHATGQAAVELGNVTNVPTGGD
jgi:acyl dehydratase